MVSSLFGLGSEGNAEVRFVFQLLAWCLVSSVCYAQGFSMMRSDAIAREVLLVRDENDRPVPGAVVTGGLQTGDGLRDVQPFDGITDSNGVYVIQGKCTDRLRCDIRKDGYYDTEFLLANYASIRRREGGRWLPFGSENRVVLKKIVNPKVDGHRSVKHRIPTYGEWIGYDLEKADWVPPWGKGQAADVLTRFTIMVKDSLNWECGLELSFTNNPFAGAYMRKKDAGSLFTSAYSASTNASFQPYWEFRVGKKSGEKHVWRQLEKDSYLVFRTRTRIDEMGELVSAHYGRIDGVWKFFEAGEMQVGGVYFNIISNDVNLEDKVSFEEARLRERDRAWSRSVQRKKFRWWPWK